MAKEIERKFLVTDESWRPLATRSVEIVQGYLASYDPEAGVHATVRVRCIGDAGRITVKGPNAGAVRDEWEYPIPAADARAMLAALATGTVIAKTRHYVDHDGLTWEIDEFHGAHAGLVIAEVELPSADTPVTLPPFAGAEVTDDPRYYNSSLSRAPGR